LGQPLEDDAYTTILVKNALEMAIQASYELRMFPRQEWKNLNDSLEMPISGALIQATSATGTAAINPDYQPTSLLLPPDSRYDSERAHGQQGACDSAVGNADPVLKSAGIAVLTSYLPFVTNTSDRANQMDVLNTRLYELRDLLLRVELLGTTDISTISAIVVHRVRIRANQDHWSGVHRRYPYRASGSGVV
jgi:hypothetical protein